MKTDVPITRWLETREVLRIQQADGRTPQDQRDVSSWSEVRAAIVRRPARFLARSFRLVVEVLRGWVMLRWPASGTSDEQRERRARRLSVACSRGLRALGVTVQSSGPLPARGLLVANHVSYLDMLVLASLSPAIFVAKSDVANWPLFGGLARLSGAVFIRRSRRLAVKPALEQMNRVLRTGGLVVLFPEGTSSDGDRVLPFHPALLTLAPAGESVHVAFLSYQVPREDAGHLVAYWGRMVFGMHLLRLLSVRSIRAEVRFDRCDALSDDRRARAEQLRQAILDLRGRRNLKLLE